MLTFPTLAEQALHEFQTATKTVALSTIARRRGAEVEKIWDNLGFRTEYTFDDDTRLIVRGTGRSHQVTTELP